MRQRNTEIEVLKELLIKHHLAQAEVIWLKGKQKRLEAKKDFVALKTDPWSHPTARSLWDFFYSNFDCPHVVERVGRLGDGGKWVCGLALLRNKRKPCIVYSYGISNEFSFEKEILERTNCSIHMFDHTINRSDVKLVQLYPQRATFNQQGFGSFNTKLLKTLKVAMKKNHHEFIDILKVDVEGAEFFSLAQVKADFLKGFPFAQLLVEVHLNEFSPFSLNVLARSFNGWWEMLERAGLRSFHNEPNFFEPLRCMEFSFLNTGIDNDLLHAYNYDETK